MISKESSASKSERPSIQFFCYKESLPERLAEEIELSAYTSRPKYMNSLLEMVLAVPRGSRVVSSFDTLKEMLQLFNSLPVERIKKLAPTQNRNFGQMVKHLLEIALNYYPENISQANVVSEVFLPTTVLNNSNKQAVNHGSKRLHLDHTVNPSSHSTVINS